MDLRPDLAEIRQAYERIGPHIHRTPVMTCGSLDHMVNGRLVFKCENFQQAGSFKSRGACNAVFSLTDEQAARGVVSHSSGNHAAALARAAGLRGIAAHIVMPRNSNAIKVAAVKAYRGDITFCEPTLAAREQAAEEVMRKTGAEFVHPYDDVRVIAGQGTAALEFLADIPDLDLIFVPVGGGGLLSGTAIAAKAINTEIEVVAAEPAQADDAYRSWKAGQLIPVDKPDTIADGLRTSLGRKTFPIVRELVDEILLASEAEIARAMRLIMERMKIVVEPSAAVPLAALLENRFDLAGRTAGIILSGGNLDLERLAIP